MQWTALCVAAEPERRMAVEPSAEGLAPQWGRSRLTELMVMDRYHRMQRATETPKAEPVTPPEAAPGPAAAPSTAAAPALPELKRDAVTKAKKSKLTEWATAYGLDPSGSRAASRGCGCARTRTRGRRGR